MSVLQISDTCQSMEWPRHFRETRGPGMAWEILDDLEASPDEEPEGHGVRLSSFLQLSGHSKPDQNRHRQADDDARPAQDGVGLPKDNSAEEAPGIVAT